VNQPFGLIWFVTMIAITIETAAFLFLTIGVLVTVLFAAEIRERINISISFLKGPRSSRSLGSSRGPELSQPSVVVITQTTVANSSSPQAGAPVRAGQPARMGPPTHSGPPARIGPERSGLPARRGVWKQL
jgi:hypothetical protein